MEPGVFPVKFKRRLHNLEQNRGTVLIASQLDY